ncbi:LysR family transcriptional regulator [Ottowia thiooxydans]|uniref:LysR family transcriptional regulator n=1 Tax=Ottowia thiooxydans TaxID=219182 RepID=UPI0003FE9CCC|nr:LysR family transcriptional regulator [Ottowia thiooxydans]
MNVTPRQLRIFLALAESLNFSRTAEKFFVTQPSLSKAVKDLEDELGITLFERSTRSVRLTAAGGRLTAIARRVVGEFDSGIERLQSQAEHEFHQLAIAALPSVANSLLPTVCARLEEKFGNPKFTIYDGTNASSIQRLLTYEVDFALASAAPSHAELEYEEILRDRFVLLAPETWKHVKARTRMEDLVNLPLISGTDASTAKEYVKAALLQRGLVFEPKLSLDQVGTAAGFVREGLGIIVQPYLGILPLLDLKGMRMCRIIDGPIRSVGIVRRKASPLSSIAEQGVAEARQAAQKLIRQFPAWILSP